MTLCIAAEPVEAVNWWPAGIHLFSETFVQIR